MCIICQLDINKASFTLAPAVSNIVAISFLLYRIAISMAWSFCKKEKNYVDDFMGKTLYIYIYIYEREREYENVDFSASYIIHFFERTNQNQYDVGLCFSNNLLLYITSK